MTINAVYSLILKYVTVLRVFFWYQALKQKKEYHFELLLHTLENIAKLCYFPFSSCMKCILSVTTASQECIGNTRDSLIYLLNTIIERFVLRNKTQVIRWLDQVWGREREEPPSGHLQPHPPKQRPNSFQVQKLPHENHLMWKIQL